MIKKTSEAEPKLSARRIGSVDFQKNLEKLTLDDNQKLKDKDIQNEYSNDAKTPL